MKIALLYGGQGAQREGMGRDFDETYEKVRQMYDRLPEFARKTQTLSMEELSQTHNTQRALLAYEMALTELFRDIPVSAYAGLSLGEYSALYGAGVLDEQTLWEIVDKRSFWMAEEGKKRDCLMIAVRNCPKEKLLSLCERVSQGEELAQVSNYNTKGQIVISGARKKVGEVAQKLEEEKISHQVIPVSGAFHTTYMQPVEEKLLPLLQQTSFQQPKGKIYSNYTGREVQREELPLCLAKQVSHPVQFQQILEDMLNEGIDTFIELSPTEVLAKFVKKLNRKVKTYAITSVEAWEKCREELL